jgi:hypothetical protein
MLVLVIVMRFSFFFTQKPPMLSPNEVANIDDYMPLPIIPVVTNEHQSTTENVDADHSPEQEQPMLENFAKNGASNDPNSAPENSEEEEGGTEIRVDSPSCRKPGKILLSALILTRLLTLILSALVLLPRDGERRCLPSRATTHAAPPASHRVALLPGRSPARDPPLPTARWKMTGNIPMWTLPPLMGGKMKKEAVPRRIAILFRCLDHLRHRLLHLFVYKDRAQGYK